MKKISLLLLSFILFSLVVKAQDSISVNLEKAGSLKKVIRKHETSLKTLCISGLINSKDIAYVRTLPVLKKLDLRNSTIIGNGSFKVKAIYYNGSSCIADGKSYEKSSAGINKEGESYIGYHAFSCMDWETVLLPANLKKLGSEVFVNCKNLKTLQLPDSASYSYDALDDIKSLDYLIFLGKNPKNFEHEGISIKNLIIRDINMYTAFKERYSYKKDSEYLFRVAAEIIHTLDDSHHILIRAKSIEIPEYIDILSEGAFNDLSYKQRLVIPKNIKEIPDNTFSGMWAEEIVFENPSSVTHIGKEAFKGCVRLQKIIFPDKLKSIGDEAFNDCIRLPFVILPKNIEKLGSRVFGKCEKLKDIMVENVTPPLIPSGALIDDDWHGIVYIPEGSYDAYSANSIWNRFPLYYYGQEQRYTIYVTSPGSLRQKMEVKLGKANYRLVTYVELIGDISTDDLEALQVFVNLSEIDLSQTNLFYGENLKESIRTGVGLFQAFEGITSLADQMVDHQYEKGEITTKKYIDSKITHKVLSGGSVPKMPDKLDNVLKDLEENMTKALFRMPSGTFTVFKELKSITLPKGVSSIESDNFNEQASPQVYTSDHKPMDYHVK